jgi:hypothetical protein
MKFNRNFYMSLEWPFFVVCAPIAFSAKDFDRPELFCSTPEAKFFTVNPSLQAYDCSQPWRHERALHLQYMSENTTTKDESNGNLGLKIALHFVSFLAVCDIVLAVFKVRKAKNTTTAENQEYVKEVESTNETSTDIDSAEEFVTCQIEA